MEVNINKAAELVGLTSHTLRYYEKEGLLPPIRRTTGGVRVYNEGDLAWAELVRCLRETGMPIAGIRHYVELNREGAQTMEERKRILLEHRERVEGQIRELERYMVKIDAKLNWYFGQTGTR